MDFSVSEYIIEREYLEFISLLRLYINSQVPKNSIVHVVVLEFNTILLDKDFNNIEIDKNSLNAKYLSDVSFSNNDYILNTLITLLPQKLVLHIASHSPSNSDFINTLKAIFENRIEVCYDSNICNLYKI